MSYADGSVYKGHWVAGDRVWDSDLRLADGTVYQRDGVITLPSGECYEGDWHDEMRSGKGRQVYADRRIYDGDWKDDKHHGFGMELFQELDEDNNAAVIVFDHEANTVIPLGIVDDAFRTNAETIFSGYGPAGGTDIEGALRLAESLCDPARKSMVILLSDGLSSVDAKSITTNANHE